MSLVLLNRAYPTSYTYIGPAGYVKYRYDLRRDQIIDVRQFVVNDLMTTFEQECASEGLLPLRVLVRSSTYVDRYVITFESWATSTAVSLGLYEPQVALTITASLTAVLFALFLVYGLYMLNSVLISASEIVWGGGGGGDDGLNLIPLALAIGAGALFLTALGRVYKTVREPRSVTIRSA